MIETIEWQPIETLPDSTWVLLYDGDDVVGGQFMPRHGYWDFGHDTARYETPPFTHWAPWPKGP